MAKEWETAGRKKVLSRLTAELKAISFEKIKPTLFVRTENGKEFRIELHKFSFAPSFRVSFRTMPAGTRNYAKGVTGPSSDPYACPNSPNGRKYNFRYHKTSETIDRCVSELMEFINDVGVEWFRTQEPTGLTSRSIGRRDTSRRFAVLFEAGAAQRKIAVYLRRINSGMARSGMISKGV